MRKEEKRRQLVEEALPEAGLSVFHPSLSPFPSSLLLIHPSIALWIGDALVWFCPCFALLCHHVTLPANKMNMNMKMREKRRNWQCQMPKAATVKKKKRHRAHHHSSRTPTPYTYSRILVYYYQMGYLYVASTAPKKAKRRPMGNGRRGRHVWSHTRSRGVGPHAHCPLPTNHRSAFFYYYFCASCPLVSSTSPAAASLPNPGSPRPRLPRLRLSVSD